MSVIKKHFSDQISNKLRLSQKDSLNVVKHFLSFIVKNKSTQINIHNFGTFSLKQAPQRHGRNPKTKEIYIIKARKKLSFRPSEKVKSFLNWINWSGWPDLNRRPPHPQCGALPGCATSRWHIIFHNFRFNLLLYNMTF